MSTENLSILDTYVSAGYPVLYVESYEEERAEREIVALAERRNLTVAIWSVSGGLHAAGAKPTKEKVNPEAALESLLADDGIQGTIFVFRDLHAMLNNPRVVRLLRDVARHFKANDHTLVILAPVLKLPTELQRDVTVISFALPGKEALAEIFNRLMLGAELTVKQAPDEDERDRIAEAALGLTTVEAENCFAKAVVEHCQDPAQSIAQLVMREKAESVRKTGILEYSEAPETESDVGGLGNLKGWLSLRKHAYTRKAREYGLPWPKGCLLIGLPGCGKSLIAKAASSVLGLPLIRFDIGRVFAGLVGQSEQNIRSALATIDAIGSCVVWIDELEKALAGMGGGGNTDSGVSNRVFGAILTWMQDRTGPAFVIATVNRIATIQENAPELLRKGRFDEIFFVDLPTDEERKDIFQIHLQKRGRSLPVPSGGEHDSIIKLSKGFSGAEIEQAVISAMFTAFDSDRDITARDLVDALKATVPLSKSSANVLDEMRAWASDHAVPASKPKATGRTGRRISVKS